MYEKPSLRLVVSNEGHSWHPPTEPKKQAIQRVRSRLMTRFNNPQQKPKHDSMVSPIVWKWLSICSTAATCLLLVFWNTQKQPVPNNWPAIESQGLAELQWKRSAQQITLQVKTPPKHKARLAIRNRWSLKLQGGTRLRVQRQNKKHLNVHLRQGFIQAHVIPGIQQQFVVHCYQKIRVVVTGTRFSVRQEKKWLRVEVSRGSVQVRLKDKLLATLQQGQAIRLQLGKLRRQDYSVPVTEKPNTERLFRKLAQENPKQLPIFAQDILNQRKWAKSKRRETLESIAHLLDGQKKFNQASRVWLLIYQMNTSGNEGQASLFHAAQSCRRTKQKPNHCQGLYGRWLRKFPQGLSHLYEESLYWHIQSLRQKNKASQGLQQALKDYQKRYPKGGYLPQIQKWLLP